jgi:hypothetical protein
MSSKRYLTRRECRQTAKAESTLFRGTDGKWCVIVYVEKSRYWVRTNYDSLFAAWKYRNRWRRLRAHQLSVRIKDKETGRWTNPIFYTDVVVSDKDVFSDENFYD